MTPVDQLRLAHLDVVAHPRISVGELENGEDRTLLWGFCIGREGYPDRSFHVYLRHGVIHKILYDYPEKIVYHVMGESFPVSGMLPDKRLYPEACDFEFCKLLQDKGMTLPFTTYNHDREPAQYYGLVPNVP